MKKSLLAALAALAFGIPALGHADDCDVYHDAIMDCSKGSCDTSLDDFAACLVDKHGITEKAADGTNEVEELVHCFKTQYHCDSN